MTCTSPGLQRDGPMSLSSQYVPMICPRTLSCCSLSGACIDKRITLHILCRTSPRLSVTTSATVASPACRRPSARPSSWASARQAATSLVRLRGFSLPIEETQRDRGPDTLGAPPPPPVLLLDVICCGNCPSSTPECPVPSCVMQIFVRDEGAFRYIVPGVCCGDDGDACPRAGLKGAGARWLPFPSVVSIPTDGTGLRTNETCRTTPCV
mmetsp:Transcript_88830/g.176611  ORF Transcript_88830/g.176611 Transcript_88830/m.176611 type:complete len:210 (-) Transcript_88830:443-1072(-)